MKRLAVGLSKTEKSYDLSYISPAVILKSRWFCSGAKTQVAYGVNAQGGLYALLKSNTNFPLPSSSATKYLPVG
jgi:hypothetical protein